MSNQLPPEEDTSRRLNDIAHAVNERLPEGFGFFVLVFPFGEHNGARANYVSNASRADIVNVMKEFLIRSGAGEDWLKNLK